jgi:hypothetical protein
MTTEEYVNKWFKIEIIEHDVIVFYSKLRAYTLHSAFEKTFTKWYLLAHGYYVNTSDVETCGLCDIFLDNYNCCAGCPCAENGKTGCDGTPYEDTVKHRFDIKVAPLILAEISYLCRRAREVLK